LTRLVRRLATWLNERDAIPDRLPADLSWADLPTHHPRNRD
jgi:hypothetical protein